MSAIRSGSGKAKLPPIAPGVRPSTSADIKNSTSLPVASSHSSGVQAPHQHVGRLVGDAADECGTLMKQLVLQTQQVERDIQDKLKIAIQEATAYVEQELVAAQSQHEKEKETLMAQVQQLVTSCKEFESREKELQSMCAELKRCEEQLVSEQSKMSSSLAAAGKEKLAMEDMLAAQTLQHQQEVQAMMDKHVIQLNEIDRTGEESKKRGQQQMNQVKQLREANAKLAAKLSEEEAQRQKLEQQRKDEHASHSTAAKKQALELSKLKNELAAAQQDLAKAAKAADLQAKQLNRQQAEHSDTMKKMKSHNAATHAALTEKIQELEQELVDLRLHYQAEIERLRNEMAQKMHASLDNWMGQDDSLLKKLRQQNLEEKGRLEAERHAVSTSSGKKKGHHRS